MTRAYDGDNSLKLLRNIKRNDDVDEQPQIVTNDAENEDDNENIYTVSSSTTNKPKKSTTKGVSTTNKRVSSTKMTLRGIMTKGQQLISNYNGNWFRGKNRKNRKNKERNN